MLVILAIHQLAFNSSTSLYVTLIHSTITIYIPLSILYFTLLDSTSLLSIMALPYLTLHQPTMVASVYMALLHSTVAQLDSTSHYTMATLHCP